MRTLIDRTSRLISVICWAAMGAGLLCTGMAALAQPAVPTQTSSAKKLDKSGLKALQEAFGAVAEELEPAVVTITARRLNRQAAAGAPKRDEEDDVFQGFPFLRNGQPRNFRADGTGSGVIISDDGWVLTNDHVVNGADRVYVKLHDGREIEGKVVRDFRSDLALIKIEGAKFPFARFGDSDSLRIGQWAIAIGSPYRYEGSFSVGVVSSLQRKQLISDKTGGGRLYPNMIQTDAAINPGNSGGPLVNLDGEIIGINTAIESESGGSVGIGFAIPVNMVKFVVDQLKKNGKVSYGYLGIDPETITPRLATAYKVSHGALVRQDPMPDTPAAKAGIQVEDIIVAIDEKPIKTELDLRTVVSRVAPGTTVRVTLYRDGAQKRVVATIAEAPQLEPQQPMQELPPARLGIEVIPDANAKNAEGVVVKSIDPGSAISEADEDRADPFTRLRRGDTILQVNDSPVATVEAFKRVTKDVKSGDVVRIRWQGRRGAELIRRVTIVLLD